VNKVFDKYTSIAFFLIGIAFVWESQKISESSYGSNVGPDIFPMGLGIVLILLSIRLFYEVKSRARNPVRIISGFCLYWERRLSMLIF
jgi:hypothetical protein